MSADSVIVYRNKQWEHKIQKVKARDRTYQPATGFLYAGKKLFPACLRSLKKRRFIHDKKNSGYIGAGRPDGT